MGALFVRYIMIFCVASLVEQKNRNLSFGRIILLDHICIAATRNPGLKQKLQINWINLWIPLLISADMVVGAAKERQNNTSNFLSTLQSFYIVVWTRRMNIALWWKWLCRRQTDFNQIYHSLWLESRRP